MCQPRAFVALLATLMAPAQVLCSIRDVRDLATPAPGLWDAPHVVAGPRTSLAGALADAPLWSSMDACVPFTGDEIVDGDPAAWYMTTFWAPERRADLNRLNYQGVRSFQLRRCAAGAAEEKLRVFLDRAWVIGLRVVLGLTAQHYFSNATGGCYSIGLYGFECHDRVRHAYRELLSTELVENGRYHPALETLLLFNEPSDQFYQHCRDIGLECTQQDMLRALVSAWDGVVDAERELGVLGADDRGPGSPGGEGFGVRISAVFSATDGVEGERWERPDCHNLRAPTACTGTQPTRALWAAVQDHRLVSVVWIMQGDGWPFAGQINTTLEGLRSKCPVGQDLVSIRDADHVRWLRDQVAAAGVDMSLPRGIPLGYDYNLTNRYFDLRNTSREVTEIFDELRGTGEYLGDYHTNQTVDDYWGKDEYMAGFGWGRGVHDTGIADWGHHHPVQAIICEHVDGSLHGLGYRLHNDLASSYVSRWTHSFVSTELTDNITRAVLDFNEFMPPEFKDRVFPASILHYEVASERM